MSQAKRKRPDAPAPTASNDLTAKSETEYTPEGYGYAADMRRRREASRRLPVLSSGARDPFGGAR